MIETQWHTVAEVAATLRVAQQTVRNWFSGYAGVLELPGARGRRTVSGTREVERG